MSWIQVNDYALNLDNISGFNIHPHNEKVCFVYASQSAHDLCLYRGTPDECQKLFDDIMKVVKENETVTTVSVGGQIVD